MAAHRNPAQEALAQEFDALIENADDTELAERERKANEVVKNVRARVQASTQPVQ